MTAAKKIRKHIDAIPAGEPFSASTFLHLATAANIRQLLNRMAKSGQIVRLAHGIYTKPKILPNIGETLPSLRKIARTITDSTGETILIHGAEAARQLQLSTQVPLNLVFYTNGNTRELSISGRIVKLIHVNPSQLTCADNIAGTVISALRYIGRDNASIETIKNIHKRLTTDDFNSVLKNVNHMPAWMADLFYLYNKDNQ